MKAIEKMKIFTYSGTCPEDPKFSPVRLTLKSHLHCQDYLQILEKKNRSLKIGITIMLVM